MRPVNPLPEAGNGLRVGCIMFNIRLITLY